MTIAMMMSKDRLEQEHAMLNRLAIGLMNNGNQVIRVVPTNPNDELPDYEKNISLANRVFTPMPVSWLLKNSCKEEVITALEKVDTSYIVAFGKDALQLGLSVSPSLQLPVFSEIISMKDAKRVRASSNIRRWFAATPSMEQVIANRVGEDRAALVPMGVTSSNTNVESNSHNNFCITIIDAASRPKSTYAILSALQARHDIHIFMELCGRKEHRVWQMAQHLDMADRVTCLRDVSQLRTLIAQTDLVVIPTQTLSMRSVLLEAMLCGVPVLSVPLEGFDMLIKDKTSFFMTTTWEESLKNLLNDQQFTSQIGNAGAKHVAEKYSSSAQIDAFEAALSLN